MDISLMSRMAKLKNAHKQHHDGNTKGNISAENRGAFLKDRAFMLMGQTGGTVKFLGAICLCLGRQQEKSLKAFGV